MSRPLENQSTGKIRLFGNDFQQLRYMFTQLDTSLPLIMPIPTLGMRVCNCNSRLELFTSGHCPCQPPKNIPQSPLTTPVVRLAVVVVRSLSLDHTATCGPTANNITYSALQLGRYAYSILTYLHAEFSYRLGGGGTEWTMLTICSRTIITIGTEKQCICD